MQITCLNCATVFEGDYCPHCGQKHGPAMPDGREVVGDLLRSAFSPQGKMFETLLTLLRKPGEITRAYISGQRNKYVHPVRVYLLAIFVFVAASSLNATWRSMRGEPPFEKATSFSAEQVAPEVDGKRPLGDTTPRDSTAYKIGQAMGESSKSLPPWLREKMRERSKHMGEVSKAEFEARVYRALSQNYSVMFALLVPFMAFVNWILFAGRGLTYGAHFVFMLHATAGGALMLALPLILNLPQLYWPMSLISMGWQILAARRAFRVSLWGSLWRYVIYLVPTFALSAFIGLGLALIIAMFGS